MARRTTRGWAVDTHVGRDGKTCWALVDENGREQARGEGILVQRPQGDSAQAEATGVLEALLETPQGETLMTDAHYIAREMRNPHGRGHIAGKIGEIQDRARERQVKIKWVRRSHATLRAAHDAAQKIGKKQ